MGAGGGSIHARGPRGAANGLTDARTGEDTLEIIDRQGDSHRQHQHAKQRSEVRGGDASEDAGREEAHQGHHQGPDREQVRENVGKLLESTLLWHRLCACSLHAEHCPWLGRYDGD